MPDVVVENKRRHVKGRYKHTNALELGHRQQDNAALRRSSVVTLAAIVPLLLRQWSLASLAARGGRRVRVGAAVLLTVNYYCDGQTVRTHAYYSCTYINVPVHVQRRPCPQHF